MSNCDNDLKTMFESKIQFGEELLASLDSLENRVSGVLKLKNKIKQELKFLNKVMLSDVMKKEQLLTTNIHHFDAVVSCTLQSRNVIAVLEVFPYKDCNGFNNKLCVDIVTEGGHKWMKVIVRNPKALSQISTGAGEYGQKSVIHHGIEYVACAKQNLHMYEPPQVCFKFPCGISRLLANELTEIGVTVIGTLLDECVIDPDETSDNDSSDSEIDLEQRLSSSSDSVSDDSISKSGKNLDVVNLDVTTMIAYVSSLTNGGTNWTYKEPLLNQQAVWERERPVKPVLDNIFQGKKLICCRTAYEDFMEILRTLGGSAETERAEKFLEQVEIVPNEPYTGLKLCGRIKPRSVIIFGTGHHHRAVTVTANVGFLRAAKHQGANLAVIVHESRALTESKQLTQIAS